MYLFIKFLLFIADVARASEQLAGRHGGLFSPFVVSALYSYNCAWNQEKLFAKHNKDDFEEAERESSKDGTHLSPSNRRLRLAYAILTLFLQPSHRFSRRWTETARATEPAAR
jgi:hypothetical protein